MTMHRSHPYQSVIDMNRMDYTERVTADQYAQVRLAQQKRQLDSQKYDATCQMGGIPCPAKYLGTRNKDGWHFMEVRLRASFQSRTYVNPKHITWVNGEPELKFGDKVKDFLPA